MNDTSPKDPRDLAKAGGMPLSKLELLLTDIRNEPLWRPLANKCADYYDHKQASQEWINRTKTTGEPLTIINLIQRTINGALGQEAKTRLNWKADPDSNAFADIAAVMGEKLSEVQREGCSDMAISEAYSSMLRTGIGWVEVSRNPDPLAYFMRFTPIHRNDVYWDWRARNVDKSDAAWMMRQRWVDFDEAVEVFPRFREQLESGCFSGPITDAIAAQIMTTRGNFESSQSIRQSFNVNEEEWLDNSSRKRIRFYSVYYKQHCQEVALVSGTKRIKFNPANPMHVALVNTGGAKLIKGPSFKLRHAMFAGPFRLFDIEMKCRDYPLVPFVCYSADDDRSPYGLVHGMIEPQDEFNRRRSRLRWLLEVKQTFVDEDALAEKYNNLTTLAAEVMRPDALFVLSKNRTNKDALRIEQNQTLSAEQTRMMDDAKLLIQDQPGLFSPQFGSNSIGANSGVALNSLMDQSVASLGETSDNYRTSRRKLGDISMAMIAEDFMASNMQVEVGTGKKRRVVVLNTFTPEGMPKNSVEDAAVKVALSDIQTTPAYKSQQQTFLAQAIQAVGNDPIARAILIPALLEAGDGEHRMEYAKWMRKKAGVPEPDEMNEDDPATVQRDMREQQAAGQANAQAQQAQSAAMQQQVDKTDAEIAHKRALAQKETVQAQRLAVEPIQGLTPQQPAMSQDDLINQALEEATA